MNLYSIVSRSILVLVCLVCVACNYINVNAATNIHATITTGMFIPQKPNNVAISIRDRGVDVSWTTPLSNGGSPIIDYVVEYKISSGGVWSVFPDAVSSDTFVTVVGLTNDTSYDFRVYAVNAIGQSVSSNQISAIPGAPAQILITEFIDSIQPELLTRVRITNEGGVPYEYQYTWCITNSDVNLCGGGDDIFNASAAKLIQPNENWDTDLSSVVSSAGTYWFHAEVHFGSDTSYASRSLTVTRQSGGSSSSSGGGGSKSKTRICVGGDVNRDTVVNLVDFSIMLMSFNKVSPFPNPCVDINRDGKVSVIDFSILLTQWGKKPVLYKTI